MVDFRKLKRKYFSTLSSPFADLAVEFATADKTGPALTKSSLALLLTCATPKSKREEVWEKNPHPEKCTSLVAPKVNKVVWRPLIFTNRTDITTFSSVSKVSRNERSVCLQQYWTTFLVVGVKCIKPVHTAHSQRSKLPMTVLYMVFDKN